jgi:RNA polymerase sigma factor (sigma-70 family)
MDERQIFNGLKAGDEQAFDRLFHLLYPKVRFYVEQITKNESESEDITMQCLLLFWKQGMEKFNSFEHLQSFIYKSAKFAAINFLKKERRQQTHHRNLYYLTSPIEESIAERALYKIEMLKVLYNEIDKLPPQTQQAFRLVFLEDMPRPQVAETLNISLSTVNNHCAHAKNKLRQIFSERELIVLLLLLSISQN